MRLLFLALPSLLLHVRAEECIVQELGAGIVQQFAVRPPRVSATLSDTIGLDAAKEMLNEAVVLPASMDAGITQLFGRFSEHSAVLLVGPAGLGKTAVAEAAAAAAGARVLPLSARDIVGRGDFCKRAVDAGTPVMILIESLETAPSAGLAVRRCLREAAAKGPETLAGPLAHVFIVATMAGDLQALSAAERAPFGYVAQLALPDEPQRKQYLLRLLQQISRVDAQWGAALREAAVVTLASLTAQYTFAEIDLLMRRAFIRSTNTEGLRDPVALHHFEKILEDMPPQAMQLRNSSSATASGAAGPTATVATDTKKGKKKSKDTKDPMDGIFGWCNFWLPEALHLPPVVWAMIIFGILAYFMARSTTYQPYGQRKRRGGSSNRSSLFGDTNSESHQFSHFDDQLNEGYPGGSDFPNFAPLPGVGRGASANLFGGPRPGEPPAAEGS